MEQQNLKKKIDRSKLELEWKEIVGERLSDHLSVQSLENGTLVLMASDPSWSQEASLQRESIKNTINDYFDYELVKSVRIKN